MKRIRVHLENISDHDLKLAGNPRAVALLDEIIPLSLEERAQRLKALQQKIQQGEADLFEENVRAKLLEPQKAEWIRVLHKNLPSLEQELKKRSSSQSSPVTPSPTSSSQPITPALPIDDYPSELLEFLATQKPPPASVKPSGKYGLSPSTSEKHSSFRPGDIFVGMLLCALFLSGLWYGYSSENTSQSLSTLDNQNQKSPAEQELSEQQQQTQVQFDAAVQELRFGEFDHGKTQLLGLLEVHSDHSQAEYAYIVIADTYRQRQNNPAEALRYYQLFTERYPESQYAGLAQLKMGFSYEDMEDLVNAEQMYRFLLNNKGEKSRLGQLAHERLSHLQSK